MTAFQVIAIWGLVALLSAVAGGVLAAVKRRDHSAWAAWCFVFPPALIVLLWMSRNEGQRPRRRSMDEDDERESNMI